MQKECRKIIRNTLKEKNIKNNIKFVNSETEAIVQIADLLSGENRLGDKSVFLKLLQKNKSA